jgi:hypothetical protein
MKSHCILVVLLIKSVMKKSFTLSLLLVLCAWATVFGNKVAPPALPASNIVFSAVDGDRFTINYTKGSGQGRIVVVREGSPISIAPANGTDYNANATYNTAGTAFEGGQGFVLSKHTGTGSVSFTARGLKANTRYYVSIFEFDGSGSAIQYLNIPASKDTVTKKAPTRPAAAVDFQSVTGNSLTIKYTAGDGEKRLILARKGGPVNVDPEQLKDYVANQAFKSGAVINGDNYVVYKGASVSLGITNLEPNTTYHFAVFEFNGTDGPVYLLPGATGSRTTNTGPTTASGAISQGAQPDGTSLSIIFSNGNGAHKLIVARKGAPVTFTPQNGASYEADTRFGYKPVPTATDEFVLNALDNDRTFTNMEPNSTYHFRIFDFDITEDGQTYYLTSNFSTGTAKTAFTPADSASNARFENITGTTALLKYNAPAGTTGYYRMIVMKENSAVDFTPTDLTPPASSGNGSYGSFHVGNGNYIIYGTTNNTTGITVSALQAGRTYHAAIFEYNGNNKPVYKMEPARAIVTIPNEPTSIGINMTYPERQGNTIRFTWSGGNGARKLVIARKDQAVTASPIDGTTYTPDLDFTEGYMIEAGQYVVYDGPSTTFTMSKLDIGATYHIAVFEYNVSGTGPDYLTSNALRGQYATLVAPTSQARDISVNNILTDRATFNFTLGNGTGRIFIMREGTPPTVSPQDLTEYNYSATYHSVDIGGGNYAVQKPTNNNPFTVSGLTPNTQYFVEVFEYNGTSGPVYMRPAATLNFTTASTGPVIVAPTIASSSPVYQTIDGNKLKFSWSIGDGNKRIVVMRQGSAVNFTPADGVDYTANPSFSDGADQGGGQYVVFNGSGNQVTVTNLQPSTTYHYTVYEYNGTGTTTKYLTALKLAEDTSTAFVPTAGSTGSGAVAGASSITINWNSGTGNGRLVVVKKGSAIQGTPALLSKYTPGTDFESGSQIAALEFVVYAAAGNSVTVTGLDNNYRYYYAIFEFNGVDAPVYNTAQVATGSVVLGIPLPVKWLYFTARENSSAVRLEWGTTQEYMNAYFVVERSTGGGVFTSLDTIQAKGGSHINNYFYADATKPAGRVLYRIKQVDEDGRFDYSAQVAVKPAGETAGLNMYPNPAPGYTRIGLPNNLAQATVQLYDVRGTLVKTMRISNNQVVYLQGLTPGIYSIVVSDTTAKYTERLIIQ